MNAEYTKEEPQAVCHGDAALTHCVWSLVKWLFVV